MRALSVCLLVLFAASVNADSFEELLQSVKQQSRAELIQEDKRVQQFLTENQNRKKLLAQVKKELAKAKKQSQKLNKTIDTNEKKLADTEAQLQRKVGDLGELFGAVRQSSGELMADFSQSLVSVQYPDRNVLLSELAQSKALPDVKKLEELWFLMLQEMGETGKSRQFNTEVITKEGTIKEQQVIRIGAYGLISEGQFLRHNTESNQVQMLQRQPSLRYSSTAEDFTSSSAELVKLSIDPTKGQLFDLLVLKPTLQERINQGGIIGYIILSLGVLGLLIALARYIYLSFIAGKISRQQKNLDKPETGNPLGRIALVYQKVKEKPINEREVAMEEAMIKEAPAIEKYNGFIKLLAAVAPLLGLLGTVIGMIITFQSITLFGTSDPKLMAGGISTALVTTVLGLSVAIPLLFAHTFISAKSRKILDVIEYQSVGLIAREQ